MAQNIAYLDPNPDRWTQLDQAIETLKTHTGDMDGPAPAVLRRAPKMGDKSESFCRESAAVLSKNPQILPPSFKLDDMLADLAAFDQLRPRIVELTQLLRRMEATHSALGSDVMAAALQGYKLLKVAGKHQNLEPLRKGLSMRFAGQGRRDNAVPVPPEAIADALD